MFDAGDATKPIGIGTTDLGRAGYGLGFAQNLQGIELYNDTFTSFAVLDTSAPATLYGNNFGRSNILMAPQGLAAADASTPGEFSKNVIVGVATANTMDKQVDCVIIGYKAVGLGTNGPQDGGVYIGARAAENANFGSGVATSASVVIGREAAQNATGGSKSGFVVIGDKCCTSGVGSAAVIIGTDAANSTGDTQSATIVGSNNLNNYSGTAQSCVVLGYNNQSIATPGININNTIIIGGDSESEHEDSLLIGYQITNSAGTGTVHIGSIAQPFGTVTTEVNTSSKYWPVYINGTLHKVLLA